MEKETRKLFLYPEFKNLDYDDLIMKIQGGSFSAKEELYFRLMPEIKSIIKSSCCLYHKIENDEDVYLGLIYDVTERCIMKFSTERGHFINFWRNVIKKEKVRMVGREAMTVKPSLSNIIRESDFESTYLFDCFLNMRNSEDSLYFADSENEISESEFDADIVINYVHDNFSKTDNDIIVLWMNSYSLKEIAEHLHLAYKNVTNRLYTIIDKLKRHFVPETYFSGSLKADKGEKH